MESQKRKIADHNNFSATKVVRQDSKKQKQKALNPLFMTEILPIILKYLDIYSLKNSREVCSFWGFEGGKILLKNTNIRLKCFEGTENASEENEQLKNFLNTKGSSSTFNSIIENFRDPKSLKNVLPLLLQRTRTLQLHVNPYFNRSLDSTTLYKFLDFFPNLEILHLGIYWRIVDDFSAEIKMSLLNKFESLKEIRLQSPESGHQQLTNLLFTKSELAVKEIDLFSYSPFFEKYLESKCNWPIDTLFLQVYPSFSYSDSTAFRAFLEKISGSLKHMEWTFVHDQDLPKEFLVPWANNLMNPSTFNGLETLCIFCAVWDSTFCDYAWLLFTWALQLPNLKKLTFDQMPQNLEERISKWNNHPNAKGRTLKSESLEELEIRQNWYQIPDEGFIVFSHRLWPNLKSLCIENPPNSLPTLFLLSEWIRLERLDLKFRMVSQENAGLWTKWLTGGERSRDTDDSTFTLKDLKDLKHFGICEERAGQSTRITTDFFAANGLKFMTQLQSLHLNCSKISREVKEMLKETLGPNVNVEFK